MKIYKSEAASISEKYSNPASKHYKKLLSAKVMGKPIINLERPLGKNEDPDSDSCIKINKYVYKLFS